MMKNNMKPYQRLEIGFSILAPVKHHRSIDLWIGRRFVFNLDFFHLKHRFVIDKGFRLKPLLRVWFQRRWFCVGLRIEQIVPTRKITDEEAEFFMRERAQGRAEEAMQVLVSRLKQSAD
jgi:hypothetical protein